MRNSEFDSRSEVSALVDLDLARELLLAFHRIVGQSLSPTKRKCFLLAEDFSRLFCIDGKIIVLEWDEFLFVQVHLFSDRLSASASSTFLAIVMVCHNSNPLFYASRKSNEHDAALFVLFHFNLCGIVLGSFGSCRGVIIVATIGSSAVEKHVCRPSRNLSPRAIRPLSQMDR